MTRKDLRRMSKDELIEIIHMLQESEVALQEERQQLEAELQQNRIPLQNAGSLVDCGQKVMDLLQQAQQQTEQEAEARRAANADSALYAEAVVKQAKVRAEKMICEAKRDAVGIQMTAKRAIERYLKDRKEREKRREEETRCQAQAQRKEEIKKLREIYKQNRTSAMG